MSVRQNSSAATTSSSVANVMPTPMVDMTEASQETALAEGNNFNVASAEAPLKRNVVVSIKSNLNGTSTHTHHPPLTIHRLVVSYTCRLMSSHAVSISLRPLPPEAEGHLVSFCGGSARHLPVRSTSVSYRTLPRCSPRCSPPVRLLHIGSPFCTSAIVSPTSAQAAQVYRSLRRRRDPRRPRVGCPPFSEGHPRALVLPHWYAHAQIHCIELSLIPPDQSNTPTRLLRSSRRQDHRC